jgi:hypothetical protein
VWRNMQRTRRCTDLPGRQVEEIERLEHQLTF